MLTRPSGKSTRVGIKVGPFPPSLPLSLHPSLFPQFVLLSTDSHPPLPPSLPPGNPMYVVKSFYQQLKWAPRESIHSLSCPCVVVHGETDWIIPLYQGRALAANLLKATFYVFRYVPLPPSLLPPLLSLCGGPWQDRWLLSSLSKRKSAGCQPSQGGILFV